MMELLSPAGSPEAVQAAVQNGADAVYLGYGNFNARRNAANFDDSTLAAAVEYCHLRGVKVYLTLNTLLNDRELPLAAALVNRANRLGIDALLVQDLGVARMARQVAPDLPLHASTQMTIHSLDGAKAAADLGMTRVVVSRELSRDQIAFLCAHAPVEIECFVHGALCMCYSGQCFFSSVIGGRSGNRGMCAQPCRLNYGWGSVAEEPLLSLKDMSLAQHLRELEEMGVACAKIEGRRFIPAPSGRAAIPPAGNRGRWSRPFPARASRTATFGTRRASICSVSGRKRPFQQNSSPPPKRITVGSIPGFRSASTPKSRPDSPSRWASRMIRAAWPR